jgi:hypothetical protein
MALLMHDFAQKVELLLSQLPQLHFALRPDVDDHPARARGLDRLETHDNPFGSVEKIPVEKSMLHPKWTSKTSASSRDTSMPEMSLTIASLRNSESQHEGHTARTPLEVRIHREAGPQGVSPL